MRDCTKMCGPGRLWAAAEYVYQGGDLMKRKRIGHIAYAGTENPATFIRCFSAQLLTELKKRGLLTDTQYQKGLALLEAAK